MTTFICMIAGVVFASAGYAQDLGEECDCGHNPYVTYELSAPLELDENSWRVLSVERFDIDLTQILEPEVCVVQLELIPPTDPVLYQDIQDVPEGDQELRWNDKWVLMSEFENQMDASGCSLEGAQS